jgi:AraC family transcriptional regulator
MRHHYAERISLDELAALAFMSKFHFTRVFKEVTGSTPHQYLTEIRLTRAAELLRNSDMPVGVVGLASGFHRPTYFSNAFRSRYGVSPNTFRRRARLGV